MSYISGLTFCCHALLVSSIISCNLCRFGIDISKKCLENITSFQYAICVLVIVLTKIQFITDVYDILESQLHVILVNVHVGVIWYLDNITESYILNTIVPIYFQESNVKSVDIISK